MPKANRDHPTQETKQGAEIPIPTREEVFRDHYISSVRHVWCSRLSGELEVHPFLAQGDVPAMVLFAKDDKTCRNGRRRLSPLERH